MGGVDSRWGKAAIADQLTASGEIDLILGHHVHVVEPIQKVNGVWVAYGHGNLFACHEEPGKPEEGELTRFILTEYDDGRFRATDAEYLPLLSLCATDALMTGLHRVMNIPAALATGEAGIYGEDRLLLALERTTRVVNGLGGPQNGLRPMSP